MDIGKCFRDAWELFKQDWGPLTAVAVIAAVLIGVVAVIVFGASLATVSFSVDENGDVSGGGFAAGSFVLGMIVLFVVAVIVGGWQYATTYGILMARVRERRAAEFGDLTRYFGQVGGVILATFVLGIILYVGYLLLIIPGVIFTTWWLLTLVVMVDQRVGLGEAMSQSKQLSSKVGFFNVFAAWIVLAIALGVVSGLLSLVPVIGWIASLLLTPIAVAYTVSMYLQARGEGHLVGEAAGAQPVMTTAPAPPPPPGAGAYPPPAPPLGGAGAGAPPPPPPQAQPPVAQPPVAQPPVPQPPAPEARPPAATPPADAPAGAPPAVEPPAPVPEPPAPPAPPAPGEGR
jgi:hypothetical protein